MPLFKNEKAREDFFWSRVKKGPECWEWQGGTTYGYGRTSLHSKSMWAHRLAWIYAFGEIPGKLLVLHKCDNPICVKPGHLYLGTDQDNMNDKVAKGRHAWGERNGCSKLKERDVVEMVRLAICGVSYSELAIRFKTTVSNVSSIVRGKSWRNSTKATELRNRHRAQIDSFILLRTGRGRPTEELLK